LNAIEDPFSLFGGTQTRAFLWQAGQMRDLGTLGGPDASATALSDRGQVAGISYTNWIPNPSTGIPTVDPFYWKDGDMTDLGTLGGTFGVALGLNKRGQVIGISNLAGDQTADPFLWDSGTLIDLYTQTIGGNFWTADAINDVGRVVGAADFSSVGGLAYSAALWRNGKAIDLGTPSGDCCSEALAINSEGQAVGVSWSNAGEQRAFLWEEGTLVDLNSKTPPGFPLTLVVAYAINEHGEIGGFGLPAGCGDVDACSHAFLLIPDGQNDQTGDAQDSTNAIQRDSADPGPKTAVALAADSPSTKWVATRIRERMARRPRGVWQRNH
jgi:probable HAF family extracellular repeat protein